MKFFFTSKCYNKVRGTSHGDNQKVERESTKDTGVAPAVQIVTEEEYLELFGKEATTKYFMEIGVILGWRVRHRV